MDKESALQNFGLTDAEVKVYTYLLQSGEATASQIAKKTGTNRTFTYDRLKKLGDIGLVSSVIKDNKKCFMAAEPSQLLAILEEREEQIKNILPVLEKLKRTVRVGADVEVYSGIKGVKTALNLMIKEKRTICLHGTLDKFQEIMPTHFGIWNTRRINEKINMRILSSEAINLDYAESGLLSEEEQTNTSNFVFGNITLIVMWSDYPIAIIIKSREMAQNNLAFFNTIWNREVKIYTGAKGMQRAFIELLDGTKELLGFGYSKRLSDAYTVEFSDEWHIERIKRNIKCRIMAYEEKDTREYFRPRLKIKKEFYVRYLPRELQGPACISLSDKMVATFVYTEKRFRVVLNKNRETVKVYKKYFDELWKKARA